MKLETLALLVIGVFVVRPDIKFPAFTEFVHGEGPTIKGKLFPFLFVTIACGAISGFHSLVSSGTTPKMLDKECDARLIGYGAMMAESLVAVLSVIATCSLFPGDYSEVNVSADAFAKLGPRTVNLDLFSSEVGETLAGRTGGAVSLAVGMAQIFRGIPGMTKLMGFSHHYAIMFEALFILTMIDTGTRAARYVLQELLGKLHNPFANHDQAEGYRWVVDLDLEKFFDRVNYDRLLRKIAERISDKQMLKMIRAFLRAGVMENGLVSPAEEGTP